MKYWLLLALPIPTIGYSQSHNDPLDAAMLEINYGEDTLKSVFDWVANAIEYDVALLGEAQQYISRHKVVSEALTRRKGVCLHYASLFDNILQRLGYESHLVVGYTRQRDKINDELSHAWNAVKVDSTWYFFDPTWSSGYVDNSIFFKHYDDLWYKVPPEEFIRTHMPFDPMWQLTSYPLSHHAIEAGKFDDLMKSTFNFEDSLALHLNQDTLMQLRSSVRRIKEAGQTNPLLYRRVDELNQQIIVTKHNRAIALLNSIINDFNQYIAAKNSRFRRPKLSDEELRSTSILLSQRIDTVHTIFSSLVETKSLPIRTLRANRTTVENTMRRIHQESAFIERYLKTWKIFRAFAFH